MYLLFYNNYNIFVQDLCMYNNKKFILAQSLKENVSEGLSSTGKILLETSELPKVLAQEGIKNIPKFVEDIKSGRFLQYLPTFKNLVNRGVDLVEFFAPLQLGDTVLQGILALLRNEKIKLPKSLKSVKNFKVPDNKIGTLKGLGLGVAGTYGAEAIMSGIEEMRGSLNIYKDYHSDYVMILKEIVRLLPSRKDLQPMIANLLIAGNTGLDKLRQYRKASSQTKSHNYRIAIKGQANIGSYLHNFFSGAVGGAAATKSWQGALISGLGDAFYDIGTDVYYNMQDNDYKATALAKELIEKAETMAIQVAKFSNNQNTDPAKWAEDFMKIVVEFEDYMRKNVYKPSKSKLNPDYYRNLIDKSLGRNK